MGPVSFQPNECERVRKIALAAVVICRLDFKPNKGEEGGVRKSINEGGENGSNGELDQTKGLTPPLKESLHQFHSSCLQVLSPLSNLLQGFRLLLVGI